MAQLRQDFERIQELETQVAVLGPDSTTAFKQYWLEHDLPFIGLPDPEHAVLDLFGQEIKIFKFGRMPAQVIIDKQGIMRFAHYGNNMADIPSNDEIMEILHEINQAREDK